ncbi:MAG TPA: translocation/assembly module TamB domain-containing protein [Thermoanaerobaculia bacterium]|nr:translocation/assembly module TamB domain-containing protein [Thermoanaerobaculia bacterium]
MSDADGLAHPAENGGGEPPSSDPPRPEPAKPRGKPRRAGRLRRFVLRPLVWGGALFLVLFVGLLAFVESSVARSRLAALVTARASEALGRPVRLGDARIGLLPLEIELHDLVIPGRTAAEPPFAEVPVLRIQASWRALRQRVLDLEQIEALRPIVRLDFAADGSTNLPVFARGGGGRSRFRLNVDRVLVQQGTLVLNHRALPLSLEARGVWGRVTGPSPQRLSALATAQDVAVVLPGAKPYHVTASLKGLIEPAKVTIESFRLAGPDLAAHGSGHYAWANGKYRFDLDAAGAGDAALVGRWGYLADPLTGKFTFTGRVDAAPDMFAWLADLAAPRVLYGEQGKREIRDLTARATGGPRSVDVAIERARYAEGNVAGQVSVDITKSGPAKPIAIDLDFDQVDIARFLAAEGLDLAVASRGAGSFVYHAKANDLLGGSGEIAVRLAAAPASGKNGPLPVGGDLPLRIDRGVLSSPGFRLTAPSVTAEGTASYDLQKAKGTVAAQLATADLAAAVRLIPPAAEPEIWRPTAGHGTARIDLALDGGRTTTAVDFDLSAVAAPALVADRLAGSFSWLNDSNAPNAGRIDDLRVEAHRGDALLVAAGRIPLGSSGRGLPLALTLEAESWPAAEIARLAADLTADSTATPGAEKAALPDLEGRMSGTLSLGGSFAAPTGRADLTVEGFAVSGYPLGRATAAVAFGAERVQVERLQLATAAGALSGNGRIDRASGSLALGLEAPDLDLAAEPFASLLGGKGTGSEITGRGSIHASVSGTLDHPEATITARATGLTLDGRPLAKGGPSQLVANWDGETVEAHGSLLGLATFAGGGRLDKRGADVDFSLDSAQLKTLVEIAAPDAALPEISGSFSGRARLAADFSAGTYRTEVELPKLDAQLAGHRLKNVEPIVLRLDSQRLEIVSLYLAEAATGSDLFAAGTIGLGEAPQPLDLKLQSTIEASWLSLFSPGLDAGGYLDAIATVRGTLDRPAINGEGEIRDARLILPDQAIGLEEVAGTVLFNRDQIVLDSLRARVGAGTLRASGRVSVPASGAEISYSFQAIADRISLRFPEGFLSRGDAQISLVSSPRGGRQVSGEVKLDRAFYLDDVAVGTLELLSSAFRRERLEVEEADAFWASTALNIRVVGPGALRVRNNVADLRGDVDLSIRGSVARPVVFGAVEIAEGGKLVYADNEYQVERGRITFDNPNRIDPVIDLTAKTEVRNYEIALDLSGTVDRLTAHFRSEDGLADLDVLSLLATGRELEPGTGEIGVTPSTSTEAPGTTFAAQFLASQAASAVSKRVQNLFNFDRFRIDPLAGGNGSFSNIQLTVGKRLSKKLFVTYTTTPSASETTVLQAEWQVGKNVVVLFTSNGNDRYSVDIQWEKRR